MKEHVTHPSPGVHQVSNTPNGRTTSLLSDVLDALTKTDFPLSAYDILRCVSHPDRRRVAPPTIYRALEKLIADGLVGRLESRNAFVRIRTGDPSRLVYCICDRCGAAQAVENTSSCQLIDSAAETLGFQVRHRVMEVQGVCAQCSTCPSFSSASQHPNQNDLPTRAPK
ncbi:Fur family transcriptional regulator [Brytella acorum]|uniref:Transcriptional repressor n=1 Tax=Brytella acorum TaxID=2959299 RepID=A0AA35UI87_9PROT|nr:transcriptional repressor [Brytella acorum]CAI9121940.1 transcriptional repressor [Brytella acorum]